MSLLQQPRLLAACILIAVLCVAVAWRLIGIARVPAERRPHAWRVGLLIVGQVLAAWLLLQLLWPRTTTTPDASEMLVVASSPLDNALPVPPAAHRIALPEAGLLQGYERVPDLATALRRWPGTRRVEVLGDGLIARDRDAIAAWDGASLGFVANADTPGLRTVSAQRDILEGLPFAISGTAQVPDDGIVELLDPAGRVVARADLTDHSDAGRFRLDTIARGTGPVRMQLRLRRGESTLDTLDVPVWIRAMSPSRILIANGGPAPEAKFLARWALDNGATLHQQTQLGGGMQAGDAWLPLNAATLSKFDLAIIDERVWSSSNRDALLAAVRNGLGLLVRVGGPLDGNGRAALRNAGFAVSGASVGEFALPPSNGQRVAQDDPLRFSREAEAVTASGGALLRDAKGTSIAAWRGLGRGRMGVWLPVDTYQLALAESGDHRFAALWTSALNVLARPSGDPVPEPITTAWSGERATLCGLADDAHIRNPDGVAMPLLIDPATGARRCAAWWPAATGWHQLADSASTRQIFVRDPATAPGLHGWERREATRLLASPADPRTAPSISIAATREWPQWAWFLAWLLVMTALWWFERTRIGRR